VLDTPALRVITTNYMELVMTTGKTNLFISHSASSKFINSTLRAFKEKIKNYIGKGSIKENQSIALSLTEETDPQQLEREARKTLAYNTFFDQIYIFLSLSKRRGFSIKYLDSFKERILRDKSSLFSQAENLEMLFLIDLIKEIRKLSQKTNIGKGSAYNAPIESAINEMTRKLYNNLPEPTYDRLVGDELER
jgi:hypothetical protein